MRLATYSQILAPLRRRAVDRRRARAHVATAQRFAARRRRSIRLMQMWLSGVVGATWTATAPEAANRTLLVWRARAFAREDGGCHSDRMLEAASTEARELTGICSAWEAQQARSHIRRPWSTVL